MRIPWGTFGTVKLMKFLLSEYNYQFPLICCPQLDDMKELIKEEKLSKEKFKEELMKRQDDLEACKNDHYTDGTLEKIKKVLVIILIATSITLAIIIALMILLVVAACSVIRKGPKKDEFAQKYLEEEKEEEQKDKNTELSRLVSEDFTAKPESQRY